MPTIKITTKINAPIGRVFDLARSIELHTISTAQTNEKAIAGVTTGLISLNETVTWRAKHFGIDQTLTSIITEIEKPNYFVDEMVHGAFKDFKHSHRFTQNGKEVFMLDLFEYSSPFGWLGVMADKLFLKNYMTRLLEKRNKTIKEFAESNKWKLILDSTTNLKSNGY